MKKFIVFIAVMFIAGVAFAGWTATPKELKEYDEGVNVTVVVTDGTYTETLTRPVFHAKEKADITTSIQNIIAEVKKHKETKENARALISAMSNDINKSIAEDTAIKQ